MEMDYNFKYDRKLLQDKMKQFMKKTEISKQVKEVDCDYINKSEIFTQEYKNSNFIQYTHLYFIRLNEIKNRMQKIADSKWNKVKICKNIIDVKGTVL
jgi:hypothetical protein